MARLLKVPESFISGDCTTSSLALDGASVLETCVHTLGDGGTMFFREHALLMQLAGEVTFRHAGQTLRLQAGEMVLMRRSTAVEFERKGDESDVFDSLIFCIKDELLTEFLTTQQVRIPPQNDEVPVRVGQMDDFLTAFAQSLRPFFDNPKSVNPGLLRLKLMEMLYDIMEHHQGMFRQMLQLHQPARIDIHRVVEQHYSSPITIEEMAYLSGRSLSSFKRDFQTAYGTTPARWIREHRLLKAHELLTASSISVSDVCFSLGFENLAHFSQLFKRRFGVSPSEVNNQQK